VRKITRNRLGLRGPILALLVGILLGAAPATALEIGRWTFENGTANDSVGSYDFTTVAAPGEEPVIAGGVATFDGDEGSPSYLETPGYGGNPNWTVSILLQSDAPFDQGSYQGILSNNNSASANYSWQIESFGGVYQLRTQNGVFTIGTPTGGWDRIVVRKIAAAATVISGTTEARSYPPSERIQEVCRTSGSAPIATRIASTPSASVSSGSSIRSRTPSAFPSRPASCCWAWVWDSSRRPRTPGAEAGCAGFYDRACEGIDCYGWTRPETVPAHRKADPR
jgi:hypothetical protein